MYNNNISRLEHLMVKVSYIWSHLVISSRWWIISLSVILLGLSVLPLGKLYHDNSNERFFIEGDPNLQAFDSLLERFGDVEYLFIGIQAHADETDLFTPRTIEVISALTRFLENRDEVSHVRSLTNYRFVDTADGGFRSRQVFEQWRQPGALARAREIMRDQNMALGTLLTPDMQHTRIDARILYQPGSNQRKLELMNALRRFIDDQTLEERGYQLRFGGHVVYAEQFQVLTNADKAWIYPSMVVVISIILMIIFGSVMNVMMCWLLTGTAIVMVTGIQASLGWPHTVVESTIVPTLLIIGVSTAVHVLGTFNRFRGEGMPPAQAARLCIEHLWVPALCTAITTSAGFMALSVTRLVPVQQFAWLGAIGTMLILLLAITLLPAALSLTAAPPSNRHRRPGRFIDAIPRLTRRYRLVLTLLGALLLAGGIVLIPRLQIDSNFTNYFKPHHPLREDSAYFDRHYGGIKNIDFMIDSGESDGIHEPDFLHQVDRLQTWLKAQPETGDFHSLLDIHKHIHQAVNDDDPAYGQLPDTRQMAAQFLLLFASGSSRGDLDNLRDFDRQWLLLSVPIRDLMASDTSVFLDRLEAHLAKAHPDLPVVITGSMVMYNAQDEYINHGVINSFLIALVIMATCFLVLFRSIKYGLIGLIPSIVPILLAGSLMALLKIPLNLGTMVIGAMTMGIAVDDSFHMLQRYLSARRQGQGVNQAITTAVSQAGRAVILTSIILISGFLMMLFSSFVPYVHTGLLAAFIMLMALIGDIVFLPALLALIDKDSASASPPDKVLPVGIASPLASPTRPPGREGASLPSLQGTDLFKELSS